MGDTDKAWKKWGGADPYFGVLSLEEFRKEKLSPESRAAFFKTGQDHIDRVIDTINRHVCAGFKPTSSLDFGCGVGRLVIPLAGISDRVVGVDISDDMLAETRRNCDARNLNNVDLVKSDDALSRVSGSFDLVHSYIVLQHIVPDRGQKLCARLMEMTAPGGVTVLHFDYSTKASRVARALVRVRYSVPLVNWIRNIVRGVSFDEPVMERNLYDLSAILDLFQARGFDAAYLKLSTDRHFSSVTLYAQRRA